LLAEFYCVVSSFISLKENSMALEYELFYLVGEKKEAELPQIKETVAKLVTDFGGTFLAPATEESRKLAYEIQGEIRGTYIARRFTSA
jgi:ribosomal protein S6